MKGGVQPKASENCGFLGKNKFMKQGESSNPVQLGEPLISKGYGTICPSSEKILAHKVSLRFQGAGVARPANEAQR